MKKTLLIVTTLLIASSISAQSQVHVAANIGIAPSFGYSGCLCGVNTGITTRKGRFGFDGDFDLLRIRKTVGGSGTQVKGSEAVRYFHKKIFVEGDAEQVYYSVTQFHKTNLFLGGGVGTYLTDHIMVRGVFLAYAGQWPHVTDPSRQNAVKGEVSFFLKHHVFVRGTVTVGHWDTETGLSTSAQIGWWK
jgi:hypothetical protein